MSYTTSNNLNFLYHSDDLCGNASMKKLKKKTINLVGVALHGNSKRPSKTQISNLKYSLLFVH